MDHFVVMIKFSLLILGREINKKAQKWAKALPQELGIINSSASVIINDKATSMFSKPLGKPYQSKLFCTLVLRQNIKRQKKYA